MFLFEFVAILINKSFKLKDVTEPAKQLYEGKVVLDLEDVYFYGLFLRVTFPNIQNFCQKYDGP